MFDYKAEMENNALLGLGDTGQYFDSHGDIFSGIVLLLVVL